MIIEMKITGCSDEPRLQELFYILSQMKGGEVPPIPPEELTPEEPTPAIDENEKFRVEVKGALDNDEKEAVKKRVRPSRAKKPAPAPEPEETRVITDVDLRMKAKSLLDEGKRGKLITALAEFKNGEFPKVSDIKDDASRLEFMVVMEAL